jgi:hypothetical protein
MRISIVLICIATAFVACKPNPHTATITQLDSLNVALTKVKLVLDGVDTAQVYQRLRLQLDNINYVQQTMDPMSREVAFLIDRYGQSKKAYSRWGGKIPAFYEEHELRQQQLKDLKTDLENNAIDLEKGQHYLNDEALQIRLLSEMVIQMDSNLRAIENRYNSAHQEVTNLIDSLKQNVNG